MKKVKMKGGDGGLRDPVNWLYSLFFAFVIYVIICISSGALGNWPSFCVTP